MTKTKKYRDFIVIKTWSGRTLGTTHEYHQRVRCPVCNFEFERNISEGCFHLRKTPWACPNCNYPLSLLSEIILRKTVEKETFNPSKRLKE